MKIARIVIVLLLIILVSGFACGGNEGGVPTLTPTPTPTPTPIFQLSPLTISPSEAISGETVTISTTVSNSGGAGTYQAELEINGAVVDAKDVTVPSGGSRTATFYVTRDEPGTYNVQLGDRRGSFTVAHPPLNVMLDYIGVRSDHDVGGDGEIYLLILVDDGEQTNPGPIEIPLPGAPFLQVSDYETKRMDESLFHTSSVGDYLKIMVIAYDYREPGPLSGLWPAIGGLIGLFFGHPELGAALGSFIDAVESQAPEYEYIGSYQATWGDDESWGIGKYDYVGEDDLRLWFRIWSDSPQQPVSQPSMGLPNVVIQDIDAPSEWPLCHWFIFWLNQCTNTITLRNWESHPVNVRVERTSSMYPDNVITFDAIVPANGTEEIIDVVCYKPEGVRTITYKLFFRDYELDTWLHQVNIVP